MPKLEGDYPFQTLRDDLVLFLLFLFLLVLPPLNGQNGRHPEVPGSHVEVFCTICVLFLRARCRLPGGNVGTTVCRGLPLVILVRMVFSLYSSSNGLL